jgi:LPXTG-motif cell wall-anchored protein
MRKMFGCVLRARARGLVAGSLVVGVVASILVMLSATAELAGGQSLPSCGGQNAAPQAVPYTCTTKTRLIDGSEVTAVLVANGETVTVTYTLAAPRATDAPIRINHHLGISGGGGPTAIASGVIPAGQTSATLVVTTPCVAGQIDIKFVFVLDSQPEGRVGGPWIENGTGCTITSTTTTTPSTPSTAPSTAATTTPGSVSQSTVRTLPSTGAGRDTGPATIGALAATVIGGLLVLATRRRAGGGRES